MCPRLPWRRESERSDRALSVRCAWGVYGVRPFFHSPFMAFWRHLPRVPLCVLGFTALVALLVPAAAPARGSDEVESYLLSVSRLYESLDYEHAFE